MPVEVVGLMDTSMFGGFFQGKNVLITGHTGFKGSWLSVWLLALGAKVIGYAKDPRTKDDNFVVSGLSEKLIDIRGDIRDLQKLKKVFDAQSPEIVFHMAAQPLVRHSYLNPAETFETNVMGTLNVLECIRSSPSVKVGVLITSDKCYENKEQLWGYRESDPVGGFDPYSASKGCAELLISSYRNSFFNPNDFERHKKAIASVRAGNVIGGGDYSPDRIIPDCIKALSEERPVEVRNPDAVRPWQHVLEPLYGYLLLASLMQSDAARFGTAFNFGPDFASISPVREVVKMVIDAWGGGEWLLSENKNAPHEAGFLSLDCTKAKTLLRWMPRLSLREAVESTVFWYRSDGDKYSLCRKQIDDYCQKLIPATKAEGI